MPHINRILTKNIEYLTMSDLNIPESNISLNFAAKWAFSGVIIGVFAFWFNYTFVPVSLPGYEILAGPAMIALSLISEETPFWPKMAMFLTGQYLGYFFVIFAIRQIVFGKKSDVETNSDNKR